MKRFFVLAFMLLFVANAQAQDSGKTPPYKVSNLTMIDINGDEAKMPHWGEKNLLIFYVDPDESNQNEEFVMDMEVNHRAAGDNIYGFGVINLKDSWYPVPNSIVRKIAAKRTEKNGAYITTDPDRRLAKAWGLGDCNNKFVFIIISKEGELVYYHKGEIDEKEQAKFYSVIDKYR